MPTYRNNTQQNISIKGKGNEDFISPGSIIETYVYENKVGLELVSDEPVYTPLICEKTITGVVDDSGSIPIDSETEYILCTVTSGIVDIYNVNMSHKMIRIQSGDMFGWENKKRSRQLMYLFVEGGTMICSQYQEKCDIG